MQRKKIGDPPTEVLPHIGYSLVLFLAGSKKLSTKVKTTLEAKNPSFQVFKMWVSCKKR